MGTHPIFESDFDCLTDWFEIRLEELSLWSYLLIIKQLHRESPRTLVRNSGTP